MIFAVFNVSVIACRR